MRLKDHLEKLEYFCAVVESGSLNKASALVFVGQPQLTKIIQQLEDVLNVKLFLRSSKGLVLTRSGDRLYEAAKEILRKADEAEFSIQSSEQNIKGRIVIGTYDSIARYFFPQFLKYLKNAAPHLKVVLRTGRSQEIFSRLQDGDIEIAILVNQGFKDSKILFKNIYSDSFGFYKSPQLSSNFNETIIYLADAHSAQQASFKKLGFSEEVICENLETVRSLAEEDLGVAYLPRRVAQESVRAKKLSPHYIRSKKMDFDSPHSIDLCVKKDLNSDISSLVLAELERFLQIWSKN